MLSGFSAGAIAPVGGPGWNYQLFVKNGTWLCPGPDTRVHVVAIGGGSGGGTLDIAAYSGATSSAGGTSAFGALVSAVGGASVSYQSQTINVDVSYQDALTGVIPGLPGIMGFGTGGSGAIGGQIRDGYDAFRPGRPGNAGTISQWSGLVSANQSVVVGLGGAAAYRNQDNYMQQAGQQGAVMVFWKEAEA